nr:hypothetical protein [uncultured Acinetobacter sp.]
MNKNEFLEHFFKLNLCNFTANSQMFGDKDLNVIVTKDDKNQPQTAIIELFMENDLNLSIILDVSRPDYEYETSNSLAALSCFFVINQRHISKTTQNRNKGVVLIYNFLKANQFLV